MEIEAAAINPTRKLRVLQYVELIGALLESAAQGILVIDADGMLVLVNTAVEKMFGYNEGELPGQPLDLLIPEESRNRHAKNQKAFFANPKMRPMGIGLDLEAQRKDGSRFPIEVSLNHVDTTEGRLGVAFISDVTERKRVEEALRRSELQNREFFEHMSEGLAYCKMLFENGVGSDFVYLMVNQRFEVLTGLKDVTGKRVTDLIPGIRELDPGLFEIYSRVSLTGVAEKFERLINSLQEWYSVSVYSPEKGYFVAIFEVVGERKRMEETLRQNEERLRLAADSTGLGTFDFDPRTGKLIWSDVAKSYFGLPPEVEVDDATFRKGLHPEDRDRVQRIVDEAMRPESRGEYATEYRTVGINDGKERWLSASGRVLFDPLGQPQRFIGVMMDISEKKHQEKLAEANRREIRALAASLLTVQEEERRRVARDLHDQICQQLASFAFTIDGLSANPPPAAEMRGRLRALRTGLVKTAEETRQIAHNLYRSSVVDDLGLVTSLQALCEELSEREGIVSEFSSDVLPDSIPREIPSCLYLVAQEGLQNVARHSNATHVSVALSCVENSVLLSLEDDGDGFDTEMVRGKGGLGLISMEERARSIRGSLSIASRRGHGARITLRVPLASYSHHN